MLHSAEHPIRPSPQGWARGTGYAGDEGGGPRARGSGATGEDGAGPTRRRGSRIGSGAPEQLALGAGGVNDDRV